MRKERIDILLIILATTIFTVYMVREYIVSIFSAFIIAYIFYPVQKMLSRKVGEKISAFLITLSFLIAFSIFSLYTAKNVFHLLSSFQEVRKGVSINITYIKDFEEEIYRRMLEESIKFARSLPNIFIKFIVFLILTYYMLCDGEKFLSFIRRMLPEEYGEIFIDNSSRILKAIVYGHLLAALVQGTIAFLVYAIAGLPYLYFFGLATFITAFIGISPAVIYIPASFLLFFSKNILGGLLVLLSGIFIVSTVDNIIKPSFASKIYALHPALFLVSILGGVSVFGFVGTFIGPLVVGILKAAILSYKGERYDKIEG